jgi:glutathione S-transferase
MIARDVGIPLPAVAAWVNAPAARRLAGKVDADEKIKGAIADVPVALDHVDELISAGVIGGDEPNAADFQISTSVRAIMTVQDLRPAFEGRPAAEHAMRFLPELGNDFPAGMYPAELLEPVTR